MRRAFREWEQKTHHATIFKPPAYLGAPWIDQFVALRKSVALCEDCFRKYNRWWKRYQYEPVWAPKELTDCDGCAKTLAFCTGFYPAERGRGPWAQPRKPTGA